MCDTYKSSANSSVAISALVAYSRSIRRQNRAVSTGSIECWWISVPIAASSIAPKWTGPSGFRQTSTAKASPTVYFGASVGGIPIAACVIVTSPEHWHWAIRSYFWLNPFLNIEHIDCYCKCIKLEVVKHFFHQFMIFQLSIDIPAKPLLFYVEVGRFNVFLVSNGFSETSLEVVPTQTMIPAPYFFGSAIDCDDKSEIDWNWLWFELLVSESLIKKTVNII